MSSKNGKRLAATPARSFAHLQGTAPKGKVAESEEDKKDQAEGEDKDKKDDETAEDEKPPANDKEKGSKSKKAKKAKCDDEEMAESEDDDAGDDEDDEDDEDEKEKKEKAELALSSGAVASARGRERARCSAIFSHEAAAGRTELAANLAFNTTMTANEAVRILGSVPAAPAAKSGRLASAMSSVKQPAVGPDGPQAGAKPTSTAMAEGITRTLDKVRGQQSN